jgi:hypothetical protein
MSILKKYLLLVLLTATTIAYGQTITIINPNGGENLLACTVDSIRWNHSGTNGYFNVDYSLDGGINWAAIATNFNGSACAWTVPNIPSTQCLVRVVQNDNPAVFDLSNGTFTISTVLKLITPNGGENWQVGAGTQNISWTANGTSTNLRLQYSTNSGSSWTNITNTASAAAGVYTWTIPNAPSTNCLVKVLDPTSINGCKSDASDALFTIAAPTPTITITSPNTPLTWYAYSTYQITWTNTYLTGSSVKIEYSVNGGNTWNTIVDSVDANDRSYNWTVPNIPSNQCKIRISKTNDPSINDISDVNFNIERPAITITSPNTPLTWYAYSTYQITWSAPNLTTAANVKLEYSINGGNTWNTIVNAVAVSPGTYSWTIPNIASNQCRIRISKTDDATISDISDVNFTIAPPLITVNAPNTDSTYYVGNPLAITWTNTKLTGLNVKIDYSIDNGINWLPVVASVAATTSTYSWTIPNTPSNQCLVRVSDALNPAFFDVSNLNFTIALPVLTITSPNGGESWRACTNQNITWTKVGSTRNVSVEYSVNGGSTWILLTGSQAGNSFTWTSLPDSTSNQCLVRVKDITYANAFDVSNANFTILADSSITVLTPNGGENWQVGGSTQNISWTANGTSSNLRLQYSTNSGSTWTNITTSTPAATGVYTWTIPNAPSNQCLVKVLDPTSINGCKSDVSDATFTIATPTPAITITSPNTPLTWYAYSTYQITWTSTYLTGSSVKIEYSIDGGNSWFTIISSVAVSPGTYDWIIPNIASNQCRIRISKVDDPTINDISDVNFTIAPPLITVNAPNAATTYYVGDPLAITWTNTKLTGLNVKIDYSIDNGINWLPVVASVRATNATYSWTIPNTPSNQCLVRVSDALNPAFFDVSNFNFNIAPAIKITSPNSTDSVISCTLTSINWTAGNCSGSYKLEYSLDSGRNWNIIVSAFPAPTNGNCLYNWTMPNVSSRYCLIKISDNNSLLLKSGISEPYFIIQPSIKLLTPNGGISYASGSLMPVTWNANRLSGYYNIDYSSNGGASWINITTGRQIFGDNYIWTVPSTLGSNYKIRVTDNTNTCKTDMSDAVFSIINAPTYMFVGNGNWDVPQNWSNNIIPPAVLNTGTIIINPANDGECILNVQQTILRGANLNVLTGKRFRVPNGIQIVQ